MKKLVITFFVTLLTLLPLQTAQAANKPVPILMYHYIGNNPDPKDLARNSLSVAPDKFDAQMGYLSSQGYTPISLNTLFAIFSGQASAPAKPIVLTFDDGYIDFYLNAYPILRKYNFHSVVFIPTGLVNQGYYMSWGQIKEIQSSGLVTFESHSISHPNLPSVNAQRLASELKDSKSALLGQTGFPVNFIAYPNGATNATVQNAARSAGYVGGLGTWKGKATSINMNMPRIRITGYMSLSEFAKQL